MERFIYDLSLSSCEWAHELNLVIQILIVVAITYLIYNLRLINERLAGQVFNKDVETVRSPSDSTPSPLRVNTHTRATPSLSDIRRICDGARPIDTHRSTPVDILCRAMMVPVAVSDCRGY